MNYGNLFGQQRMTRPVRSTNTYSRATGSGLEPSSRYNNTFAPHGQTQSGISPAQIQGDMERLYRQRIGGQRFMNGIANNNRGNGLSSFFSSLGSTMNNMNPRYSGTSQYDNATRNTALYGKNSAVGSADNKYGGGLRPTTPADLAEFKKANNDAETRWNETYGDALGPLYPTDEQKNQQAYKNMFQSFNPNVWTNIPQYENGMDLNKAWSNFQDTKQDTYDKYYKEHYPDLTHSIGG